VLKFNSIQKPIQVGDQVVVSGWKAKVESVYYDKAMAATEIRLDFGVYGKSRVYAHDEGKTFVRLDNHN
jgi:hypothetical protein